MRRPTADSCVVPVMNRDAHVGSVGGVVEVGSLGLKIGDKLGSGSFGEVSRCWMNDHALAVKKMYRDEDNMATDIQPWCLNLRHENVVRVYGYVFDAEFDYVIMELYTGGDLFSFIAKEERYVALKKALPTYQF